MIIYGFEQEGKKLEQENKKIYKDGKDAYNNWQKFDGRVTCCNILGDISYYVIYRLGRPEIKLQTNPILRRDASPRLLTPSIALGLIGY